MDAKLAAVIPLGLGEGSRVWQDAHRGLLCRRTHSAACVDAADGTDEFIPKLCFRSGLNIQIVNHNQTSDTVYNYIFWPSVNTDSSGNVNTFW